MIDPLSQKLTVPAASALTASLRFVVPAACKASVLTASTRVTDDKSRHLIRHRTATLRINQPHAS